MTPQAKIEKEMVDLLRENQYGNSITNEKEYYNSEYFKNDLSGYINAKQVIQEMLIGKQNLSIKDAFYFSEAAFGDLHLTYGEYNKTITANVSFILKWLKENNYNQTDPEALHFGIQKFMSDTLYITVDGKRQGHIPYYYDYIDVLSGKDRRNYFVTKTIATGSGQCHTFPITYLILAEALDVDANLAYNPQHSFIRYKNNQGAVINYETTRSEEHTSELQSRPHLVCRLLLEKKNKTHPLVFDLVDLEARVGREGSIEQAQQMGVLDLLEQLDLLTLDVAVSFSRPLAHAS